MLNIKVVTGALGLSGAVSFVVCVLWGLITPQSVHMHVFLEQFLPGFIWLTWWEFLLGLVESFLFGVYAAIVYVPIYNWLTKRFRDAT